MKPPSRRRTEPSRFRPKSTEEDQAVIVRSICLGWTRKEQQDFLQGLKQQQNFESELDLTVLQKKVPKRPLKEIEDLVNLLKSRVLQTVFLQVQKQRKEEHKNKVPIEIWGELVQKLTGSHESTVSAAFSQMLVIAGTEPRSLINSIPPQAIAIQSPTRSSHPIPLSAKPNAQLCPSLLPTTPLLTVLPGQVDNTLQTSTLDITSTTSASTNLVGSTFIQPESVEHANKFQLENASTSSALQLSTPKTPTQESSQVTRSPSQQKSEPQPTASGPSTISTASVSQSVSLPSNEPNPAHSELSDQDSSHRPRVLKCIVNFDKIYEFISDPDSKPCNSALSSMECAVLFDMLMSLPEELSLLNCKQLQHHLLQAHEQLSKPAQMPVSFPKTGENISHASVVDSAELTKQHTMTAGSSHPPGDPSGDSSVTEPAKNKDWASAGICPLNPLMVPAALLKRHSVDCKK